MLVMLSGVAVSEREIGDVRGWAAEAAELAGAADEYMATRVSAIEAALDWVQGRRSTAPVSGLLVPADRDEVFREQLRASDQESDLRRRQERGTFPGVVAATLAWVLGDAPEPI